jgi:hypothetical protein
VNFGLLLAWIGHSLESFGLRNGGDPTPKRWLRDALPGLVTSDPQALVP